jgi:hypothetical protein
MAKLSADCSIDELNAYLHAHASTNKRLPVYVKELDGCYVWQGRVNKMGYGSFRSQRVNAYVAQSCGIAGPDDRVHQSCDNRRCIRPSHMYNPLRNPRTSDVPYNPEQAYLSAITSHVQRDLELHRDPRNQEALALGMAYWIDDAGNRVATIE